MNEIDEKGYYFYPIIKGLLMVAIVDIALNSMVEDQYGFIMLVSILLMVVMWIIIPKAKFGKQMLGMLISYTIYIVGILILEDPDSLAILVNGINTQTGLIGAIQFCLADVNIRFSGDFVVGAIANGIKSGQKK